MITTSPKALGLFTKLSRSGRDPAPYPTQGTTQLGMVSAKDGDQHVFVPPLCSLITNSQGNYRAIPIHAAMSTFQLLPGATSAAAGKDPYFISLGVGTEVIARAAKGGVNVKTQVTVPANSDDAMLTGLANNGTSVPLTSASLPRLATRVNLSQITLELFSATLDETFTSADPTVSAGDGAGFVFDPTGAIHGLGAAANPNWLMYQKVAGADVFVDTGIPVVAGVDYDLEVAYDTSLIPSFLLNGNQVGGPATAGIIAGTTGHTLTALVGVKIIDAGTPTQKDFDCRFISVERLIG